jgi:hypothetical protein
VEDKFKRSNFPFGKEFEFQMDFELKIQEANEIWMQIEFKRASNLLGKINKFTKILAWHDLQYFEFRLTHLYSKIWCSFTSGN